MISQSHNLHRGPRPFWQLLLAEQTGQLPALTCDECQALLECLGQLVNEGCDPYTVANRMRHCLVQAQLCRLNTDRMEIMSRE